MFDQFAYVALLLVTIACLSLVDRRWKLAWFDDRRRTAWTIGLSLVVFIIWDMFGVGLGIFSVGDARWLTGIRLMPEFPIEELFFLYVLTYTTLLVWRSGERLWPRT